VEDKSALRARLADRRRRRSEQDRRRAALSLASHGFQAWQDTRVIAAYAAIGTEPPTHELVERLTRHGIRVLMPVVNGETLDWAAYEGWDRLVRTAFGLLEPEGARLGTTALAEADVVLAPALAVDRAGHRLGRGRGYYDRALAGVDVERVVAVVFDDEVLDQVPHEPHDRRVHAALTPSGLLSLSG
jgi:5-formyltetrahydrofolate cyclo-ligase